MTRIKVPFLLCFLGALALVLGGIAQQSATEAPAGFDTPTVINNPGSQSSSNGISEATGDTFALDQKFFERHEDAALGLGPVFNATGCAECHANPVAGGVSQFTEIRAG